MVAVVRWRWSGDQKNDISHGGLALPAFLKPPLRALSLEEQRVIRVNWLASGAIWRGWAHSASGATAEGIAWIVDGIRDYRATGSMRGMPYYLALKAEALYLAGRTPEALEAIKEAEAQAERSEERWWCAELHRLRGVFLTAMGAEAAQIQPSFQEAIRVAKEQKSISLAKRAEATYAEYRRQKASASGGHGFRLPLC